LSLSLCLSVCLSLSVSLSLSLCPSFTQLAHDVVPKTAENFMHLCEGSQQFSYRGSKVCDILKEASLRLGDVETNNGE
jgi:hypothetical protein